MPKFKITNLKGSFTNATYGALALIALNATLQGLLPNAAQAQNTTPPDTSPATQLGDQIRVRAAPIRFRRWHALGEAGAFSNSRGTVGSTVRLGAGRVYYLNQQEGPDCSGGLNMGIALNPRVELRLDSTPDNVAAQRDVQIGGLQLFRVHGWRSDANGGEATALNRADQELETHRQRMSRLTTSLTNNMFDLSSEMRRLRETLPEEFSTVPEERLLLSPDYIRTLRTLIVETIRSKISWDDADRLVVCSAEYRQNSIPYRYAPEQAQACSERLASPENAQRIQNIRNRSADNQRIERELASLTPELAVLTNRRHRAETEAQSRVPLGGRFVARNPSWGYSAPSSSFLLVVGDASFQHRYNSFTARTQTGALLQVLQLGGTIGASFNSLQMEFCASVSPLSALVGRNEFGDTSSIASYHFAADICTAIHLGRLGRLRNQASVVYNAYQVQPRPGTGLASSGTYQPRISVSALRVANFLGLERIGGTPISAGWRYEYENTNDATDRINGLHTHFGVINAEY